MHQFTPRARLLRLALSALLIVGAADHVAYAGDEDSKADERETKIPQVGNDDIFGFTSASELGDAGDKGFAVENDGRIGKRRGLYGALNSKFEFSYSISSDLWVAASGFVAAGRVRHVPGIPDGGSFDFDGFSVEVAHRLITRSETNPWGVTVSVEPRWGRVDGESGLASSSFGFEAKLFVDRVVVPDRVFWAANAVWAPQWSQDPYLPGGQLVGSGGVVSTALSWQVTPNVYVGAEVRYLTQFGRIGLSQMQGQSVTAGPTFLWKLNDKIAVNATLQPQIWGRSNAAGRGALDLDNFERALFRLKLAWTLG